MKMIPYAKKTYVCDESYIISYKKESTLLHKLIYQRNITFHAYTFF